jgi:hypothetical protein
MERSGTWHVSGIFDLHTSRFGDGEADLCRMLCSYLDTDESLAVVFLDAYRAKKPFGEAIHARMPLYLINERLQIWHYFATREADSPNFTDKTFHGWSESYLGRINELL